MTNVIRGKQHLSLGTLNMDADEEFLLNEEGFEEFDGEEDQIELPPEDKDTADTGRDLLGAWGAE